LFDMVTQHPLVDTPVRGKEMHGLYHGLVSGWSDEMTAEYLQRYDVGKDDKLLGECTPYYMRAPWVVDVVATVFPETAPLIVILRDPVERFESAVRHALENNQQPSGLGWYRRYGSDLTWGGMYASQLATWFDHFGMDRFVVLQYEKVVADPQHWVDLVWKRIGVDPVPLKRVSRPSRTSTNPSTWTLETVPGLRARLRTTYEGEVSRLTSLGIDRSLWPNFADSGTGTRLG
jgi:hypothetical protein